MAPESAAPFVELLTSSRAEDLQRRCAGALSGSGVHAGDRVAFRLPSSATLLCAVLGAARTGVIPVMLNATLTEKEVAVLVEDSAPELLLDTQEALAALRGGRPVELAPYPLTRPMHYTSGTTGRPKGVHAGPWDEAKAKAVLHDEAEQWGHGPQDLHLICSPMYHSVSLRFASATLLRGGSCIVVSRFDAGTVLSVLRRQQPTTTFMVPSHLQRVLSLPELDDGERWDSLRLLAHAGEPCPPKIKRAAMDRCKPGTVWEFYGSTEGQFTVCSSEEWLERPGTVGKARVGRTLEIETNGFDTADPEQGGTGWSASDEANQDVGVIWCHAPEFARFEYWRDPASTVAAWRGDAFTVRDLGHLDADGYLYLSGRREDLIISGGVNVYPAEVEAALAEVPGVREVAVFGIPDDRWGQRVCAAVVARDDVSTSQLEVAARERLAPYKRPKQYARVDELPYTATGKLRRGAAARQTGLH